MKTKMNIGYAHMDMSRSTYKEYIKGTHEISPFNPDRPRTGTHAMLVDGLGGDRIPLDPEFNYSRLDTDIIYIWFQGGVPNKSKPMKALKKLRKQWDGVLLINWEEVYQFTNPYAKTQFMAYMDSTKYVDAVVSGFLNFDKRMEKVGLNVPWRYLITPYDTEWLKYKFGKTQKDDPRRIYSMLHGRTTKCERTIITMYAFKNFNVECVMNRYRFVSDEAFRKRIYRRIKFGKETLDFLKIVPPIDPWVNYMKYLSSSYLFIDEYPAYSQSHSTLEAACGGTPTISHQFNSSAVTCFPKTVVELNNVSEWVAMTKRLIMDEDFYNEVRDYGLVAATHYGLESFYNQLLTLYEEFKR